MKDALTLVKEFCEAFFARRDVKGALALLTRDIRWFGASDKEDVSNIGQAEAFMAGEVKRLPAPYTLRIKDEALIPGGAAFLKLILTVNGASLECRVTACARDETGARKLCSMHISIADTSDMPRKFTPHALTKAREDEIRDEMLSQVFFGGLTLSYLEDNLPIFYVNRNLWHSLGYDDERDYLNDVGGMAVNSVHPDERKHIHEETLNQLREKGSYAIEYRMLKKGGGYTWVRDLGRAFITENGREALSSMVFDISEQKDKQTQIDNLISNLSCGFAICHVDKNRNFTIEYLNDGYYQMLEENPGELDARYKNELLSGIHPDDRAMVQAKVDDMRFNMRGHEMTYRYITSSGTLKWIQVKTRVVLHSDATLTSYSVYADVTELMTLQRRLSDLINSVPCGICMYHWNGDRLTPLIVNARFNEMLGEDVFNKMNQTERFQFPHIHPEDRAAFKAAVESALKNSHALDHTYRSLNKHTGKYAWLRINGASITQPDGSQLVYASYTDVTAERAAEQEQRTKYELERSKPALGEENLLAHALFNLTTGETLEYAYKGGESVPARDRTAFTEGAPNIDALLIDECEKRAYRALNNTQTLLKHYAEGKTEFKLDFRRKLPNGDIIWVRCILHLIRHPGSADILLFEYFYDVDEERNRELTHISLADANYDYVARINGKTGKYTAQLKQGLTHCIPPVSGEDADIMTREIANSCILPEDRETVIQNTLIRGIKRNLENRSRFSFTCRALQPDGSIRYKRFTQYYLDRQRELIILTREDVTELIRAEAEKNNMLAGALETAKAASLAKSQFLSRVSHELRTPMNAIIGLSALAGDDAGDVGAVKSAIGKINDSAKYLLSLINDILEMSRIESGHMTLAEAPFELADLIGEVSTLIDAQARAKGVTYIRPSRETSPVMERAYVGDATKLKQILVNVLGNAVKFTPPGGTVTLSAELRRSAGERVKLRFTVSDTGMGIDAEFMPRLFDAFSQESPGLTSESGGTGLGLAITRSLTEMMGGKIEARSVKGAGAIFDIDVVLRAYCGAQAADKPAAEISVDLRGRRILLAEDQPLNVEVAKRLLEKYGAEVAVARNGLEALNAFERAAHGYFDAILMDVRMPVMDGLTATQRIRALDKPGSRTIPIIALTANAFDEDVEQSLAHGMDAHLIKPIDPNCLRRTLNDLIPRAAPD